MSQTLVWPNGSTTEPTQSDPYGPRGSIPGLNTRPFHVGQDWHSIGSLKAIGAGTVIESGWGGWAGWQVLVYLGEIDGVRTWVRYCHLASASPLSRGDRVSRGDHIGWEGDTGDSAGKHVHLEIYRGQVDRGVWADPGRTVDPRAFIGARLHPTIKKTASAEEEEEDMAKHIGTYIGGDASTPAMQRVCAIYNPDTGYLDKWSGASQDYINQRARTHDTGNFMSTTRNHFETVIEPMLAKMRERKA